MAEDDEVVQPPEGQGDQSNSSPYAEYLDRLPEEVRGDVEPVFRDWDAQTTRKFQDAAEYRKQWEPLEQTGVSQRDPAEVQWAMQFVDALQNPSAIKEWFDEYAQQNGLTAKEQQQLEQEYVDPTVESLVEQRLAAQLGPVANQLQELTEWRQAQEFGRAEAQAMAQIRTVVDELKAKHGDEFNEQMVEKLLPQYIQSDPQHAVERAFADWQQMLADVQKQTLQSKVDQPAGAESGGSAVGSPEPPVKGEALKMAAAQALEQLRANKLA
jgi:hypothetical protein